MWLIVFLSFWAERGTLVITVVSQGKKGAADYYMMPERWIC